jgi:putative transposase
MYHVTQRGAGRGTLFLDEADRARFLERLGDAVEEDGVRLYIYCLMTNHFHLLVETPRANVSAFMHRLQTAYTLYFNLRHGRSGHLMQGRFGARLVQGDRYLLNLSRYIHLNPVMGLETTRQDVKSRIKHLQEYGWSSYRGYAGLGPSAPFVEQEPMLSLIGGGKGKLRQIHYRRFVESGLAISDAEWAEILKGMSVTSGMPPTGAGAPSRKPDHGGSPRIGGAFRHTAARASPEAILKRVATEFNVEVGEIQERTYAGLARSVAALMLARHARMTQREVAVDLGFKTAAAVSQQIGRLKRRMKADPELAGRIATLAQSIARPC